MFMFLSLSVYLCIYTFGVQVWINVFLRQARRPKVPQMPTQREAKDISVGTSIITNSVVPDSEFELQYQMPQIYPQMILVISSSGAYSMLMQQSKQSNILFP